MEIIDPNDIFISKSVRRTLNFISDGIEDLNSRDLSVAQRQKILESLMVPHIRSSLGIEDIRASARQTKEVLDFYRIHDEVMEGKGNREIVNLQAANDFICSDEALTAELNSNFILNVHYLVTKDTKVRGPGQYKDRPNEFKDGTPTPLPIQVPEYIETICQYFELSDEQDPIVLACWLHNQIAKLHPFNDGNGRVARTLQDWVLYKNKYLPCSTGSLNRMTYYDILEEADDGNWEHLIEHISQAQSDSLAIAMQSIKASESSKKRRSLVVNLFKDKKETSDEQEYNSWRYLATQVVSAFEQECENYNHDLKEASDGKLWCKFIKNDLISKSNWNLIKSDGFANRTNAFVIYFYAEGGAFYKTVGYCARHFLRESDKYVKNKTDIKNAVSIYLGGHDEPAEVDTPAKARKLKNASTGSIFAELPWHDNRISLREVLLHKGNIYKYRYITSWLQQEYINKGIKLNLDSEHETWILEDGNPEDIASEYIGDIFRYKTGIV